MPEIRLIAIDAIDLVESFKVQIRDDMDQDHVAAILEKIQESDRKSREKGQPLRHDLFPPVVGFASESSLIILGDGLHRLDAAMKAGRDQILCEIHEVDDPLDAADEYGLSSNTDHGLKRNRATCRRIWERARRRYPNLHPYGPNGIQGKTKLSTGAIGDYLREDQNKGIAPTYQRSRKTRVPFGDTNPSVNLAPARGKGTDVPEFNPQKKQDDAPPHPKDAPLASLVREIGGIIGKLDALVDVRGAAYLDVAAAGRHLKSCQDLLRRSEFAGWCPRCHAEGADPRRSPILPGGACKLCGGSRFVTRIQIGRLDDKEQEFVKRLGE